MAQEEDFIRVDPVLAHMLLGTVAAAKGAVDTVLAHSLEGANGESLLRMAVRRLDHLAEQLRHLALGLPPSEVLTPPVLEDQSG
jgi:hypothetical protein